jgi:hypothetical protein
MIPREVTDPAKAQAQKLTGIPPERILISATHTHSAPTVSGVFQSDPDEDYQKHLAQKIAEGIAAANKRLTPARIGWAVGQDPDQVFNRRWKVNNQDLLADPFGGFDKVKMNPPVAHKDLVEPAGPIDPAVSILSVQAKDGKPLALLANYSLHYVGGFPELSADYFGVFAEKIQSLLDADTPPLKGGATGGFVGIMSNGTSGNINNVNFRVPRAKQKAGEQLRIVADSVAAAALKAYKSIEHRDWVPLAMAQKEIELGVRLPNKADIARAEDILAKAAANKKGLRTLPEIYARETVLLAKYPVRVPVILQALRIGELGIVANPCETFVEIGLEIKQKSPLRPTFTIELANGYNGYLPTPEHHELGGYETWRARSSYLEANASRKIIDTWRELLDKVAR